MTTLSFPCTQCGAGVNVPEGEVFLTCAHCASALYLDRGEMVLHYLVARTLDAPRALNTLKRWMASAGTAKDLDRKAEIEQPVLRYFPLWRFKIADRRGEQVQVEPAKPETLPLLEGLTIPPGELRFYSPDFAPYLVQPTVSYEAASKRLLKGQDPAAKVREAALVHVPVYLFRYRYRDQTYNAAVDAASGGVFASLYPVRRELPYRATATVTLVAFLLAAFSLYFLLPLMDDNLTFAYSLRCGIQLLVAVPLFLLARLVARKA